MAHHNTLGVASWSALCVIAALQLVECSGAAPPLTHPAQPPPYDLRYRESRTYHITRDARGKYQLSSEVKVSITPLTGRATRQVTYGVHEAFYARVEDLQAEKDGDSLSSRQIEKTTSQGKSFLYNDQTHLLKFKHVQVGQTISWRYREQFTDIRWLPWIRVPNHDRLERFQITVNHPPEIKIVFDVAYHRGELKPRIEHAPTRSSITFENVPHVLPLKHLALNRSHATIWIQVRRGDEAITPVTPAEYASWYRGLFRPSRPFTVQQKNLVAGIVGAAATELDRVARLYDWVRSNIRYLADERGINGIVPRDPPVVIDRRYGDCKDMAYLFVAMAKHVGIRVDPVLVGVYVEPQFDGVHDWTFDHVIASYVHDGRRIFFDPTCDLCEPGNLPERDVEKDALVIGGDNPVRLTIPSPKQDPSIEVDLHISPDRPTEASASIVLRNGAYRSAVQARRDKRGERLQAHLSRIVGAEFYRMLFSNFEWGEQKEGVISLKAKAGLDEFVVGSSGQVYIPKVPFTTRSRGILTREKDECPLHLNDYREHVVLRLHFPRSHFSLSPSPPLALGSPETGLFAASAARDDSEILFAYSFQQLRKLFPPGKRRDRLFDLYRSLLKNRKQMFCVKLVSP